MDSARLILLIEIILSLCFLIYAIIRNNRIKKITNPVYSEGKKEFKGNKKIPIIQLLILILFILCISAKVIPNNISIREREWSHNELSNIFMDISKKYLPNNKSIVLNYHYKSNLSVQFYRLKEEYGFNDAKKKIIPILTYVLKNELSKSGENIDTIMLFDKIQSAINDTLPALKLKND